MKVWLVTGGAGFIGSHFVRLLLSEDENAFVVNLDALTYAGNLENLREFRGHPRYRFVHGNVCDGELLRRLFETHDIARVVHFAAESHVDRSIRDPEIFARTNVLGTVTLLNAAKAAWERADGSFLPGRRFLQVSTDEVYGSLGSTGLFSEETPPAPRSPYSAGKAAADLFLKAYGETYGFPFFITRCGNNYGPRQHPEKLIPRMLGRALARRTLPVYGDGLQVRDWIYVEDHCKAIRTVIEKGKIGQTYNIGARNERTNLEIVRRILCFARERGIEAGEEQIRHVADRKGHDRRYALDTGKIERELGWRPEVDFDEGLARTLEWYYRKFLRGEFSKKAPPARESLSAAGR